MKTAVIGAGPLGLSAARELLKQSHEVTVFEADDRLGGMCAHFDFAGTAIERYYHFHCTSDLAFFELLKELGLEDKLHWRETKMSFWYQGRLQPWGNPAALLKFKGLSLIAKLRYGLHAFYCVKRPYAGGLDQLNALPWIRRWVGQEAFSALWDDLFTLKFHQYKDNLSAAWIWSRIRRLGRSRYSMMLEKLGYVEGGCKTWLSALERDLRSRGCTINLSARVVSVTATTKSPTADPTADQQEAVHGRWRVTCAGGLSADFDCVISTIPLPYIPEIFSELSPEILSKYRAQQNLLVRCVILKLSNPVTGSFWLNTSDPAMDIPGLIEYTALNQLDGKTHIIYAPYYLPHDHPSSTVPDDELIARVKRCITTVNPQIKEDNFLAAAVSRYEYAQPLCPPNFKASLPPLSPAEGLFIADTSFYYPEDRGIAESLALGRTLAQKADELKNNPMILKEITPPRQND